MKLNELLTEKISGVVYHYTNLANAVDVLSSGNFKLSHIVGSRLETGVAAEKYPYYMSFTRSLAGEFHQSAGAGVMFNINGDYYNQRFRGKAVDWHYGSSRKAGAGELEDRLFSKKSEIPAIPAITAIHMLYNPASPSDEVKTVVSLAEKNNIPVHVYKDSALWVKQSPKGRVNISNLQTTSPKPISPKQSSPTLEFWHELFTKNETSQLSPGAKKLVTSLVDFDPRYGGNDMGFEKDISSASMPGSTGRELAVDIIKFITKYKLKSFRHSLVYLYDKWKSKI